MLKLRIPIGHLQWQNRMDRKNQSSSNWSKQYRHKAGTQQSITIKVQNATGF